jgi:hypothetical protein
MNRHRETTKFTWIAAAVGAALAATACGSGGDSGTTGSGGESGGTGGGAPKCLDASAFKDLFTIEDASFCAIAVYEADEAVGYQAPSWGSHHGPLGLRPDMTGGGVTLVRWTPPAGATGMLTKQETHVAAGIPAGAFPSSQAIDLPFFGWTGISWAGAFPATQGKIIMIKGGAVDVTYDVNGAYAVAGVSTDASTGRLLATALSPIGAPTDDKNGLYAADTCATPKPDLGSCGAPSLVAAWGNASGPIAVDRDGDAFVVLDDSAMGTQEARGFAAAQVARGAAATDGATLFTLPGFGSSLAAITPTTSAPGVLVFQPFDGKSFAPLDVVAQLYTGGAAVAPQGQPTTLLKVPATSSGLFFLTDDEDRLWVAASGMTTTTFVVLARK